MSKSTVAFALSILCALTSIATAGNLELETFVTERGSVSRGVTVLENTGFGKTRYGASAFAVISQTWAQIYAGPTVTLKAGDALVILGTGIGFEQGTDGLRSGSSVVVIKDKHLAVGVYETTLSGGKLVNRFYVAQYAYQATGAVKVGAMARRFAGVGPRVDIAIPGTKAGIWVAPLYDPEFGAIGGFATLAMAF